MCAEQGLLAGVLGSRLGTWADRVAFRKRVGSRPAMVALITAVGFAQQSVAIAGACEVRNLTHRSAEVVCPIEGSEAGYATLEVMFGGFHDDSIASMELDLDGKTLACAPEDRTARSGEDGDTGDVALTCRFALPLAPHSGAVATARVRFHHADFAGARKVPERPRRP